MASSIINANADGFSQVDMDRLEEIWKSGDDVQLTKAEREFIMVLERREVARSVVEACYRACGWALGLEDRAKAFIEALVGTNSDDRDTRAFAYARSLRALLDAPGLLEALGA